MQIRSIKTLNDLLLLGDPRLYQICDPVLPEDKPMISEWVADLDNVMKEVRAKYNFGRAIAAPQLGIMKRLIYMNIDSPTVIINPALSNLSNEKFKRWDDCMSFPNLLVEVERHRSITLDYFDENFTPKRMELADDLSELLQHEYDHLDGILCTMRAISQHSFRWRK